MVQCSAPRCNNSSSLGYLLKRFPRNPERRAMWADYVQKPNWEPTDNSYICEVHFDEDQWESRRMDRLKWNAVPTIFYKRPNYIMRRERWMPDMPPPLLLHTPPNLNHVLNTDQEAYAVKSEDYLTDTTEKEKTQSSVMGSESGDDVECDEMFEYSSEAEEDSKKDEIIAELRKQLAEKDRCLVKYEKIICQMNSHLEKLKGRLKFWRDFSENDKFSLRKVRKIHKSFAV